MRSASSSSCLTLRSWSVLIPELPGVLRPPGTTLSSVVNCDLTKEAGVAGVAELAVFGEGPLLKVVVTEEGPVGGPAGLNL